MNDPDIAFAEFEDLGEEEVRKRLGAGLYNQRRAKVATAWLEYKVQARKDAFDQDTLTATKIAVAEAARSASAAERAAAAAEHQAASARRALKVAWGALIVSVIAILVTIWSQTNGQAAP